MTALVLAALLGQASVHEFCSQTTYGDPEAYIRDCKAFMAKLPADAIEECGPIIWPVMSIMVRTGKETYPGQLRGMHDCVNAIPVRKQQRADEQAKRENVERERQQAEAAEKQRKQEEA
ncbi:MAG: hypothetical protein ACT4TC_03970, partial [Myxococcaceae bacterium]